MLPFLVFLQSHSVRAPLFPPRCLYFTGMSSEAASPSAAPAPAAAPSAAACVPSDRSVSSHVVVLFCASHIRDEARLFMFERMLQSVKAQAQSVRFWCSISAATPELKTLIRSLLTKLKSPSNRFIYHIKPRRQFEHYEYLVRTFAADEAVAAPKTWVAFVDDDDELAPMRIATFQQLVKALGCFLPPFVGIVGEEALPPTAAQATLIQKGYVKKGTKGEYTSNAVYFPALHFFFLKVPSCLWANRFCDLYLMKYLCASDPDRQHPGLGAPAEPHNEYVYWSQPGSDQDRDDVHGRDDKSIEHRLTRYLQYDRVHGEFDAEDFRLYMRAREPIIVAVEHEDRRRMDKAKDLLSTGAPNEYTAMLELPTYLDWLRFEFSRLNDHDAVKGVEEAVRTRNNKHAEYMTKFD